VLSRYAGRMTVRDLLTALQALPRDAEQLLAFEAGCEDYGEREIDESSGKAAEYTCTSVPAGTTRRHAGRPCCCPGPKLKSRSWLLTGQVRPGTSVKPAVARGWTGAAARPPSR
jgi:hypothetical protein